MRENWSTRTRARAHRLKQSSAPVASYAQCRRVNGVFLEERSIGSVGEREAVSVTEAVVVPFCVWRVVQQFGPRSGVPPPPKKDFLIIIKIKIYPLIYHFREKGTPFTYKTKV